MGDMADYLNEQIEDFEESRADYYSGRIIMLEAYDRGIIDERGYDPAYIRRTSKHTTSATCRCCGRSGMTWAQVNKKWTLHEGKVVHQCPVNPLNRKP
jgi:hypothetical protein